MFVVFLDYEDSNSSKPDRIWFKTVKRLYLVLQETVKHMTSYRSITFNSTI